MPRASGNATVPNDPPLYPDTPDEDILIGDLIDPEDDSDYPPGPDELGFYTFFLKGEGNLPDLLGIEDDQLLAIQNDLHKRMKARDEARERAISKMLRELEQKHEFALIWFQQHKADFEDLTIMKNMFLARYNPWGKTKREQLQSWNNLSFDLQKTDIDKQINLVLTLGNMLQQDEQAKMEKFIETMPTIKQTHLIIAPNWEEVTKKAKNLEHIIQ